MFLQNQAAVSQAFPCHSYPNPTNVFFKPGLDDFTAADEALRQGAQLRAEQEDAHHVSMEININIPEVALDLTYDVALASHLVLAVRTLEMQVNRYRHLCYHPSHVIITSHVYPSHICTPSHTYTFSFLLSFLSFLTPDRPILWHGFPRYYFVPTISKYSSTCAL